VSELVAKNAKGAKEFGVSRVKNGTGAMDLSNKFFSELGVLGALGARNLSVLCALAVRKSR